MKVARCIFGGVTLAVITIGCSLLINGAIFGEWHDQIPIARPMDAWQVIPGMAIATILWGILMSLGFALLYDGIPGTGIWKGLCFGLVTWMMFIPFIELWGYLQFDIPFMVVISGMITYLVSLPIGGIAIAAIYGKSLE